MVTGGDAVAAMNMVKALNSTLRAAMEKDDRVVILGEDVGKNGGVFRVTDGLQDRFGSDRVIDTPLAESGIIGAAVGMSLAGLRPIPEIQFLDFIYPAFDQIVSEVAKYRYRSGGQFACPMVIRTPSGGGVGGGHYHSQSTEAYFAHTPGLKVVMPSNPYDAKGLLNSAIRDPDPVIFLEPKRCYHTPTLEVPEGDYTVPLGEAKVVKQGSDASLITWGAMVYPSLDAAGRAEREGIDVEVVDLRCMMPFDGRAILETARKTGRVVVVCEATRTASFASEVSAHIAEHAVDALAAPIVRVTGFDTPFPYSLEMEYLPTAERVLDAVKRVAAF
jgi:2-oxoisovalerate dehydrogenase E1 component beta subunit